MKLFKEIQEQVKRFRGPTPNMKREGEIAGNELSATYRGSGHDEFNKPETWDKTKNIVNAQRTVYGIDPNSKVLPDLWAAGPHVSHETGRTIGQGSSAINVRSFNDLEQAKNDTHFHQFPELLNDSGTHKPFVGGRIDHNRRTITIINREPSRSFISRFARPNRFMSRQSIDAMVKTLQNEYPEYDIADFTGKF